MRALIASDSFKESCSAMAACEWIARGLGRIHPEWELDPCPLADGGEGTMAVMALHLSTQDERVMVHGPLGELVEAHLAWLTGALPDWFHDGFVSIDRQERVVLIEAASCLGLGLVPQSRRDPTVTSSYGLGQLIAHAHRQGATMAIVGLGGTSTVDAGLGMAQALGATVEGAPSFAGGGALANVTDIELSRVVRDFRELRVIVATDVSNPLLGVRGAARAFGPQKGATSTMVEALERGIAHYARKLVAAAAGGQDTVAFDEAVATRGAGAAGGLAFALKQLLGARIVVGIDLVMRCAQFEQRLRQADVVVTGEGRLDESSFEGKVVGGVVARARALQIPVWVACGSTALAREDYVQRGITLVEALVDQATDLADATRRVEALIEQAGRRLALRL